MLNFFKSLFRLFGFSSRHLRDEDYIEKLRDTAAKHGANDKCL